MHFQFPLTIALNPLHFAIYNLKSGISEQEFAMSQRKSGSGVYPHNIHECLEVSTTNFLQLELQFMSDIVQPSLILPSDRESSKRTACPNILRHSNIFIKHSGAPPSWPLPGLPEGKYVRIASQKGKFISRTI